MQSENYQVTDDELGSIGGEVPEFRFEEEGGTASYITPSATAETSADGFAFFSFGLVVVGVAFVIFVTYTRARHRAFHVRDKTQHEKRTG